MGKVSAKPHVHFLREADTQTLGQTVFGDSEALAAVGRLPGPPAATSQGKYAAKQWSCEQMIHASSRNTVNRPNTVIPL